jgi:outer membrane immunogenic protein
MNISTRLAAGVALGALMIAAPIASKVFAADIRDGSLKDEPMAFAETGIVNWSGLYIGGQVGYNKATTDLSVIDHDARTTGTLPVTTVTRTELLGFDGLGSDGVIGGGQIGYDHALGGRFLIGIFGNYNFSNVESELSFRTGATTSATYTAEKENEWSLGARAGVVVAPRTLAYIMAAYTQADVSLNGPGIGTVKGLTTEETLEGVTVGAGVEYAIGGGMFLGLEGLYTSYDDVTWYDNRGTGKEGQTVEGSTDELKALATFKWKFGGIGR